MSHKTIKAAGLSLALIVAFLFPAGLQAATLAVPQSFPTIAAALSVAEAGDRVILAPGTYYAVGLSLPNGVALAGTGSDPADVIIDGQGKGRILLADGVDNTTVISSLTFVNGTASGNTSYDRSGGAIFCTRSNLKIINCVFRDNLSAGHGGAIRCNDSSPLITDCVFVDNSAERGGGAIDCSLSSSPLIDDCTFRANTAAWGGALSCRSNSSPRVSGTLFVANAATGDKGYGGAVFADLGSLPTLEYSTLFGNKARYGGAMACLSESETNLDHCTVVGNNAAVDGGGLFSYEAAPHINASIISFQEGTGISIRGALQPTVTCSNIYGNTAGDWTEPIKTQLVLGDNLALDPLFCDFNANNTDSFRLDADSPCAASDLACGPMGAWPVGCEGVATMISTLAAEWSDATASVTWHSRTQGEDSAPQFRLTGSRREQPEIEWDVPIEALGGGRYTARDGSAHAVEGGTYLYRLYVLVAEDSWLFMEEISLDAVSAFPGIRGLQAQPNPFNPMTTISFRLGQAQQARISIYSPDGRRVAVLAEREMPAGLNRQVWNGRDSQGNGVGSGTYIVLVEGAVERRTQKITLLK